ncbi:hypothetical protein BC939DRAFT_459541 [Gamsiella multidivaricata]|uniref:uncharacterized protein n=1 Tax=Gamsiella multidivaricata TaxID=101098 RepID=UPI00221EB032|nr:uncharacterized protein BC939DRAFT_459541 [Gamsiella multidivaricata]KAG0357807.1 hypothetical protein BGZ54_000180 [Gamsiella multidivaricata]KAI7819710.1 hypothetical protein BC939DRAFT_459541 [Gamsiella multidivaricata]
MNRLSLVLLALCMTTVLIVAPQATHANTEKVVFVFALKQVPAVATEYETSGLNITAQEYPGIDDPFQWKKLSSPHSVIRTETILSSFHKQNATISLLSKGATGLELPTPLARTFVKDAIVGTDPQSRELRWYVLEHLEDGASYELRVSYPATYPTDFEIAVWTLEQAQEQLPKDIHLVHRLPQNTMIASIRAAYAGVSYMTDGVSGPETFPIPYNLVLERLYFMIPYQALKLAAAIVVAAVFGLGYLVPNIHRSLSDFASVRAAQSRHRKKAL